MKRKFYRGLANFYPMRYKSYLAKELVYAGDSINVDYWLGASLVLSLLTGIILLLIPWALFKRYDYLFMIYSIAVFFFMHFVVYMMIYYRQIERTEKIENALPDMLQLVASNLKAGMTAFSALKLSAKKEFGPLKDEIEYATTKALGIDNFAESLLEIKNRVRSDMLDRTLKLLSGALKSGGKLADVLENISLDISEMRELKRELTTSTKSYSMFIMFIVVLGAPLLLGISYNFLEIVTNLYTSTNIEGGIITNTNITTIFFIKFTIIFLLITSILASVLMGVIREGDLRYGLKNVPLIFIISVILFFVVKILVGGFVS